MFFWPTLGPWCQLMAHFGSNESGFKGKHHNKWQFQAMRHRNFYVLQPAWSEGSYMALHKYLVAHTYAPILLYLYRWYIGSYPETSIAPLIIMYNASIDGRCAQIQPFPLGQSLLTGKSKNLTHIYVASLWKWKSTVKLLMYYYSHYNNNASITRLEISIFTRLNFVRTALSNYSFIVL